LQWADDHKVVEGSAEWFECLPVRRAPAKAEEAGTIQKLLPHKPNINLT
jgi:hypothetical protein